MSIDRVYWGDWAQDGRPFQGTPQGCDQRQEWPSCTCTFNQPDHSLQDMKVAVLKAGLVNQQHRKKQEMRYIFKHGTLAPNGLNHDFSFTWIGFFVLSRAVSRARQRARAFIQIREIHNGLFNGEILLSPWRRQHRRSVGKSILSTAEYLPILSFIHLAPICCAGILISITHNNLESPT